jgi:hypothetical protein
MTEGWRSPPRSVVRVLWSASVGAGTARRRPVRMFAIFQNHLNFVPSRTQRRCAMWRMSGIETLIFIAVVAIAVALLLMLLG